MTTRERMYQLLKAGPLSSTKAAEALGITKQCAHVHLRRLIAEGCVTTSVPSPGWVYHATDRAPKPKAPPKEKAAPKRAGKAAPPPPKEKADPGRDLRRRLWQRLREEPLSTTELASDLGITRSRTEGHVRKLKRSGAIEVMYYEANTPIYVATEQKPDPGAPTPPVTLKERQPTYVLKDGFGSGGRLALEEVWR